MNRRSLTSVPPARRRQRGATFVEYALLMGLFAAASTAGINVMNKESGDKVGEVRSTIGELPHVQGSVPTDKSAVVIATTAPPAPSTTVKPTTTTSTTTSTSTTVKPTTTSTTSTTSTTVKPTTTTKAATTAGTGSGTLAANGKTWAGTATFTLSGSDGKPLAGNYNVVITVVQEYVTWDGKPGTRSWETQATIGKDGTVTFSTADLATNKNGGEYVAAMRYEVTKVNDNDPKNNSSTKWDGTAPTVRVVMPTK